MNPTFARRAVWSTVAAATAPYALYLLATRRLRPPLFKLDLSEEDLFDDLFEGEVVASSLYPRRLIATA